jgi:hypothetical protein
MLRLAGLFLGGLALACFAAYPYLERLASSVRVEADAGRAAVAEIESAGGDVQVRQRASAVWNAASAPMPLAEGDLVRTGRSGSARIKFSGGEEVTVPAETFFSLRAPARAVVRLATVAPQAAGKASNPPSPAPAAGGNPADSPPPQPAAPENPTPSAARADPALVVEKVVGFGRTLEIFGRIDPGSSLTINGELVPTAGDGSFKHFTKEFPDAGDVQLVFRVKDLAGRVRTLTRTERIQ